MKPSIKWIAATIAAVIWAIGWLAVIVLLSTWAWVDFTEGDYVGAEVYSQIASRIAQTLGISVMGGFLGALLPMAVKDFIPNMGRNE